jgi:hypothetical protein
MGDGWGTTVRDRVAKAIYDQQVKHARESIDKLQFDPFEIEDVAGKLTKESETAQVLIFYSYLDDRIQQLLKMQLDHLDSRSDEERLFGLNGPLSTFSSRVLVAYHLGWISTVHKLRLDAFRKIRNEFAHRAFRISISDPSLRPYLETLNFGLPELLANAVDEAERGNLGNVLCQLVMLAWRTFQELIVLPAAKSMQVAPSDVAGDWDDTPELLKKVSITLAGALLIAAGQTDVGPNKYRTIKV